MNKTDPGPPPADLLRRLALPRHLFGEAERALSRSGPYSGGVATSLLQDAVEALLLLLAQESKIEVKERDAFPGLFHKVGEKKPRVAGHSAPMLRLNRARVGFKHQGIRVSHEDASIFAANARAFLTEATESLGVNFWSVTLIDLVGHRRTQNWLHRAEEFVSGGEYHKALLCAAQAAAVYLGYRCSLPMGFEHELYAIPTGGAPLSRPHLFSELAEEDLAKFSAQVGRSLNNLQTQLTLIARGIDISDYRRFQAITPHVSLTDAGTFAVAWGPRHYPVIGVDESDALFGINFVVDMAIRLQETAPHNEGMSAGPVPTHTALIETDCDVIVYPDESPPEVIRKAASGEELPVFGRPGNSFPDYAQVIQEHQPAYVRLDCIRLRREPPPDPQVTKQIDQSS